MPSFQDEDPSTLTPHPASLDPETLATHNSQLTTQKTLAPRPSTLDPRVQLAAPTILSVLGTADSFTLTWSAVPSAYSYTVQYSQDATFSTGSQTGIVNAPLTSYTVGGREPNKTYYVRVKSYPNLPGPDTGSDYSAAQSIRTLSVMPGEPPELDVVTMLQQWMNDLNMLNAIVLHNLPDFGNPALSPGERRRALGSGVRRYGFIGKVAETALEYPQFWPEDIPTVDVLKEKLREIEVLRNLMILFRKLVRMSEDRFLVVSDETFRMANAYYKLVRDAAGRQNFEAEQVFQMLRLFWDRPRKSNGEPTQRTLVSDTKAVASGRKVGEVGVRRKADTFIKGEVEMYDNTAPAKQRGGFKEVETVDSIGSVEIEIPDGQIFAKGTRFFAMWSSEAPEIRAAMNWENRTEFIGRNVEVEYQGHGSKDKPRLPRIVRMRPDLD
jgi:hypothetical protein